MTNARRPSAKGVFMRRTASSFLSHKRRARKARHDLHYDLGELRKIVQAAIDRGSCGYCGRPITAATFSIDHAEPVSRAELYRAFALDNLVVCCKPCNEAKGVLNENEFWELMAMLKEWHPTAKQNLLARLRAGGRRIGRGGG